MTVLLAQLIPWLIGAGIVVLAMFGVHVRSKSAGKAEQKAETDAQINAQATTAAKVTQDARNEVRNLPPGGANQRLRDLGVMRDKPPTGGQ